MGFFNIHGPLNYTLEYKDGDNYVNLSMGFEKTIGATLSAIDEYNFAFKDNNTKYFGNGNGYLNMGLSWVMGKDLP